jgi:TetR/AcrR family transcriptional regulator, transcriptional repressor for nem operon
MGGGRLSRGRPRGFDVRDVVEAAKDLFWERGYQGTTLADLEVATGLNRSSLYQAFGTKEALFVSALDAYVDSFVAARLAGMERPGAKPHDVVGFFRGLAELFRRDPELARRGCMWVNAVAEFAGREPPDTRAAEYRDRLDAAFAGSLSGGAETVLLVKERSRMLTATTFGIWLTVRVDAVEGARVSDHVAAAVTAWGI